MSDQGTGTAVINLPVLPGGRYDVTAKLGEGGMAIVYRAYDKVNNEWCAVKVLHNKYTRRPKIRARFTAEAEAMKRLRHRNVVQIFEVDTEGARPYFAMELAEGGCVVDWLEKFGAMPPRMACDIAIQICKGLGAAHRQGVIHRDVKPHNILVNRRGVCKITDFGIAQIEDDERASMTRTGSVMGTLGYIAPEQRANAKDVDERTDLYSIGATLFTMLTARTTMDLFFADQEPELLEGIPDALKPIVLTSTRYRREERYESVRHMAKALYHAKADLAEDPPDTPSLIMNDVSELEDQYSVADASFGGLSLPVTTSDTGHTPTDPEATAEPTLDPRSDEWNDPDKPTTGTPGIPRRRLLRTDTLADEAVDGPPLITRAMMLRIGLGLSPLGVLFVVMVFFAVIGKAAVGTAGGVALEHRQAYFDTIDREQAVIEDLVELGAASAPLQRAFKTQQDQPDPVVRLGAAADYTLELRQALIANSPEDLSSNKMSGANRAKRRLGNLDEARDDYRNKLHYWNQEAETPYGRFAIFLGLAPGPDDI